jgi:hypothetical protein
MLKQMVRIVTTRFQRMNHKLFYPVKVKRGDHVVNTPASQSGGPGFKSRPGDRLPLLKVFRGFPQSLQTKSCDRTFLATHQSLIILSLDAIPS